MKRSANGLAACRLWIMLVSLCLGWEALSATAPAIREAVRTIKDGTHIHCLEAGELSDAPTLVLIPGWTLPAFLWQQQLVEFAGDRLVIAVDPRSQGDSSRTNHGNTPEQRARDLHEILTARGARKVVLVGWSQGSQDVAAYVSQFGTDSIAAVAFVDSPVAAGPLEVEVNKQWAQGFLSRLPLYANTPDEYVERMVRNLFRKPHPDLSFATIIAHARKTPVDTGISMLVMDLVAVDRRPALAKLDKPVLVIASAHSPLLDAQKKMAEAIKGSEFIAVPDAGHALFVDDPATFNRALRQLLERARGTAAQRH